MKPIQNQNWRKPLQTCFRYCLQAGMVLLLALLGLNSHAQKSEPQNTGVVGPDNSQPKGKPNGKPTNEPGGNKPTPDSPGGPVTDGMAPTITVVRTPNPMVAGMPYKVAITTSPGFHVGYSCKSASGGYAKTGSVENPTGQLTGIADASWVGHDSDCTWVVSNGSKTSYLGEHLTTVTTPDLESILASTSTLPETQSLTTCSPVPPQSGIYKAEFTGGAVWGNNSGGYTSDSSISDALVHSGLLVPGWSGYVTVTPVGTLASYIGTTANGVSSISYGSFCGMKLAIVGTPTPPPTTTPTPTSCFPPPPQNGTYTAQITGGVVWGNQSNGYTTDSAISDALVHSGLLAPGSIGYVTITPVGTLTSYTGTTQNGVSSRSYGSFCGMKLAVASTPVPISCSPTPPQSGTYTAQITGGAVWGNNSSGYTSDSSMSDTLVHSGLLAAGSTGYVTVIPTGILSSYTGTTANGVSTFSYGSFCGMKISVSNTQPPPSPTKPTISVIRTPTTLVAGKAYSVSWSSTNATSVTQVCTASGTGYTVNTTLATSGSSSGTASSAWVGYPSSCTWTATGAGGNGTYGETVTTTATLPTISVTRTPNPMVATQSFTLSWRVTNTTSLTRKCTAAITGGFVSDGPLTFDAQGNGSTTPAPADANWVNKPSSCTWTAIGPGGTTNYLETMTTTAILSAAPVMNRMAQPPLEQRQPLASLAM